MGENLSKRPKTKNFRLFLKLLLGDRCRSNPNYSLRAFAANLGISPSALSAILNAKRPLTEKMKIRLGKRLGLSSIEILAFEHEGSKREAILYKSSRAVRLLPSDTFAVISDWYHYALLELTNVVGFISSVEYVAKALNISKGQAKTAVDRLFRLGFLETDENGNWIDTTAEQGIITNFDEKSTTEANKKMQQQILEHSAQALINKPLEVRNHTTMTMAIDIADLPLAFQKIKEFRRALEFELGKVRKATHVYTLQIGFYPVSERSER